MADVGSLASPATITIKAGAAVESPVRWNPPPRFLLKRFQSCLRKGSSGYGLVQNTANPRNLPLGRRSSQTNEAFATTLLSVPGHPTVHLHSGSCLLRPILCPVVRTTRNRALPLITRSSASAARSIRPAHAWSMPRVKAIDSRSPKPRTRCCGASSGRSNWPRVAAVLPQLSLRRARRVCADRRVGRPNSNGQAKELVDVTVRNMRSANSNCVTTLESDIKLFCLCFG